MSKRPSIGIIVVTQHRANDIRACVRSLLDQADDDVEIVVVLHDATEACRGSVEEVARQDGRVRVTRTADGSASWARNAGVRASRAETLYFLDDDVIVPGHVLQTLRALMERRPDVSLVGGPNLTPPDDPEFAQLTGALLANRWGTGIAWARYCPRKAGEASESDLILCNMAIRRSVFRDGATFPELFGGEENVLMGKAAHNGAKLWYEPQLWVHHHRRGTVSGYLEQVYRYGWGRANAIAFAPKTARLAYFVPSMFTAYLVSLPVLVLAGPWTLVPLGAYVTGTVIASTKICIEQRRARWWLPLMGLFPLTHVTYGVGLVQQLTPLVARRAIRRLFPRRSPQP